jgi:hypothetical protein
MGENGVESLQDLLKSMETASKKIAELESQLAESKAEGMKLFAEFQKRQEELSGKFGFASAADGRRKGGTRKARTLAANIAVGGSRMVTNTWKAGRPLIEAKKAAMERALELSKKLGLSAVPEEATRLIEATLKRRYSKSK